MDQPDKIKDEYCIQVMNDKEVIARPPEQLHLSYDRSCNLRCPYCRPNAIHVTSGEKYNVLRKFQDVLVNGILKLVPNVTITGSGDPFGSKHYFELLKSMKEEEHQQLRITLLTNGQLVNHKNWDAISNINSRVKEIIVSVDAASEDTYKINRPPGKWDVMMKNLDFMSELRMTVLEKFVSVFIVQENNWKEMEDYAKLAKKFSMDEVRFKPILNFGHLTSEELNQRSVHFKTHPDHEEFVHMLNTSPVLSQDWIKKGAGLGNLLKRSIE
jgi:wyosine [tRNA(Phe)-imidazoG37] synthetase (radical SAM superfamily)